MSLGVQYTLGSYIGFDNEAKVVPYGKIYFTDIFTGDAILTYKNSSLTVVNTHPVILSASGKAEIFLDSGQYNIVLKDSLDQVLWSIEGFTTVGLGEDLSAWRQKIVATAGQTDFIFTNPVDSGSLIYKDGLLQEEGVSEDYIIIPPYTVQLNIAASVDDEIVGIGSAPVVQVSTLYADGSVPMSADYTPAIPQDISTKDYVDIRPLMAGVEVNTYGTTAPYACFPCDAREIAKLDYPELYAAIGDIYATTGGVAAPGALNFRIPPQEIDGKGLFSRGLAAGTTVGQYLVDVFKAHVHNADHDHTASSNSTGSHNHSIPEGIIDVHSSSSYFAQASNNITDVTKTGSSGDHSHTITVDEEIMDTGSTGDATETRPVSLTLLRCISAGREVV